MSPNLKYIFKIILNVLPHFFRLRIIYYYSKANKTLAPELIFINKYVKTRYTAIDVGANIGVWSYALSKYFRNIEAFEPIPKCAKELQSAHIKHTHLHNIALSSKEGCYELHIPYYKENYNYEMASFNEISGPYKSIKVRTATLDYFNFKDISFIKIDCEGHEMEILKGAKTTLIREKPILVVEIEQRHLDYPMKNVFDFIFSIGYKAYFFQNSKLIPFEEFSYEKHQKYLLNQNSRYEGREKNYINNFIFFPI